MEFGMSCKIKPKEKYVRISMKEIWRNLDCPSKNKDLWSYVVSFEFSRPKVAQIGPRLLIRQNRPVADECLSLETSDSQIR